MMVYVHNTAFYNFGHKVTQNFRDIQIFERHSFEKVSFGGKMKNFAVKDLRVRMYFLEKKIRGMMLSKK